MEFGGGGLEAPPDPVGSGIQAGLRRAEESGLLEAIVTGIEPPQMAVPEESLPLYEPLYGMREEASDRFVALASELVTLASISRAVYQERPLDPGEVESFVMQLQVFINSFSHR